MSSPLASVPRGFANCLDWLDEKPLAAVFVAAGATVGVTLALGSSAGWPHVFRVLYRPHS